MEFTQLIKQNFQNGNDRKISVIYKHRRGILSSFKTEKDIEVHKQDDFIVNTKNNNIIYFTNLVNYYNLFGLNLDTVFIDEIGIITLNRFPSILSLLRGWSADNMLYVHRSSLDWLSDEKLQTLEPFMENKTIMFI